MVDIQILVVFIVITLVIGFFGIWFARKLQQDEELARVASPKEKIVDNRKWVCPEHGVVHIGRLWMWHKKDRPWCPKCIEELYISNSVYELRVKEDE
jgi:hypothetical protein